MALWLHLHKNVCAVREVQEHQWVYLWLACHRQPSNKTSIVCNSLPQWNLSFGTPLFKGQKIWSQKNVYIIFVFVTSIEGTPLFWGNEHFLWVAKPPERGGGTQQLFMGGGSAQRPTPSPLLLYTIFHEKDTNFVYLLLTNGTPFVFKCCQCTVLKIGINNQNSMFSELHKALKFIY